jgi:hypothetical protein
MPTASRVKATPKFKKMKFFVVSMAYFSITLYRLSARLPQAQRNARSHGAGPRHFFIFLQELAMSLCTPHATHSGRLALRRSLSLACLFALTACLAAPRTVRADAIEDDMPLLAGRVMKYLKSKDYQNIGVLKFRVKIGNEAPSCNTGPINIAMANRLENALLIKNDKQKPFGIIHEAYRVAASHKERASYLTDSGRDKLFQYRYPLAWGDSKVQADAFVTGLIQLSSDKRTTSLQIEVLDRKTRKLTTVTTRGRMPTDRAMLVDLCQGFTLNSRKLRALGATKQADIDRDAADNAGGGNGGQRAKERLVDLEVLYDGQPVAIKYDEASNTEYLEQEPGEGQKVTFKLINKSDQKLGLVLTVNNTSLLHEESLSSDADALKVSKWVLEPGVSYLLRGFYPADDKSVVPIKVLSEQESDVEEEQNPDPYLGKLLMVVLQEVPGGDPTAAKMKVQGLRKTLPVQKNRPRTAQEAADLARKTANVRVRPMGYMKRGDEVQGADLQDDPLGPVQIQDSRVIIYRARKK